MRGELKRAAVALAAVAFVASLAASGCAGDTETAAGPTSTSSSMGGATASSPSSSNVAIGGCYDNGGCDVPRTDMQIEGCVRCAAAFSCPTENDACSADADCTAIRDCVLAQCGDASCVDDCSAANPNGADLYRALLLCAYCGCNGAITLCQTSLDALDPPGRCR
jgi:hypothetical protein